MNLAVRDFIKEGMRSLANKFKDTMFLYEYSTRHNMHMLEVYPIEKLNNSDILSGVLDLEINIVEQFPLESFYLTHIESDLKVCKPSLVYYCGALLSNDNDIKEDYQNSSDLSSEFVYLWKTSLKAEASAMLSNTVITKYDGSVSRPDYAFAA